MYLDRFSTLDELSKKERKNPTSVFKLLCKTKGFSTFEVDTNLAKSLEVLLLEGNIKYGKCEYPWHKVIITKKGKELRR